MWGGWNTTSRTHHWQRCPLVATWWKYIYFWDERDCSSREEKHGERGLPASFKSLDPLFNREFRSHLLVSVKLLESVQNWQQMLFFITPVAILVCSRFYPTFLLSLTSMLDPGMQRQNTELVLNRLYSQKSDKIIFPAMIPFRGLADR